MAYYSRPDWFNKYIFNPAVAAATWAGISVWGSRVLRVRGRKSGEWRSSPVNLLTYGGKQYLVAPRGLTQWVRNLRQAGEGSCSSVDESSGFGRAKSGTTRRSRSCAPISSAGPSRWDSSFAGSAQILPKQSCSESRRITRCSRSRVFLSRNTPARAV